MPSLAAADYDEHFRKQYPKLVAELNYILGSTELARDIAQDAFLKQYVAWVRLSRYDKPGAWVRKVAIREAVRTRRRLFGETLTDEVPDTATEAPQINVERQMDVQNAILQLTKAQRVAVVLHYYRDLPVAEVADALGCSESTAKVHLFNARKRLAELLIVYKPQESSETP